MSTVVNNQDHEYLSREGYEELKKKLSLLKTKKRVEIASRLAYAKGLGDLSENAEYQEAKEEQMINETEIIKLEDLLSRAKLISHAGSEVVRIGSTVFVQKNGNTKEQFIIVGREEADPVRGKISHESPLGKSFLGRKKDDRVQVLTPKGQIEYQIVEVA
ncbi:MAG: transcription elongation factor GreA [Candidatus Ryanbacteria bacterium]|nr:transcription elongation factor GreA [Candidatus Ryanbacteria bacterium]